MPLFTYKCVDCGCLMEKFQHDIEDIDVACFDCEGTECEKQMPFAYNRTWLNANDMLKEEIGPDAKRISDNMKKGKDSDFFDIYGDN